MDLIYQKSAKDILESFGTGSEGLSEQKVVELLERYGPNKLPEAKSSTLWQLWWRQFTSPLVWILILATGVSFFVGETHEAWFIVLVLAINAVVGFVQEFKAERTLASLKKTLALEARVIRGGREFYVSSEDLVPGDIVVIKAGDKVPADGRLINSQNLEVGEASLTGESMPVEKKTGALVFSLPVGDQTNMVFMSTLVAKGFGRFCVTATGSNTEIGKIASLVEGISTHLTPLAKKIAAFSRWVGVFIVVVVSALLGFGLWAGKPFAEIFSISLALAVSAIPEGLPVVITVILVLGMRRLLVKKALIKKLNVAETLGGVTVICTDKTGTLTKGDMVVSQIITEAEDIIFTEGGPKHRFKHDSKTSHEVALKMAMLSMDAVVENPNTEMGDWRVVGSPTEKAVVLAGLSAGFLPQVLNKDYQLLETLPFDSRNKFSATRRDGPDGQLITIVGAPDVIVDRIGFIDRDGSVDAVKKEDLAELLLKGEDLAKQGLRMIACAYKPITTKDEDKKTADLVSGGLVLAGFLALKDPVRPEVAKALKDTARAGIRTIIITGDHRNTAVAIAAELGIEIDAEAVIDGVEIDALSDAELTARLPKIKLCSRVSPENKIRIVESLRQEGEVVAMIGDGVNDAPALASADIGVAVGSGTEIAKDAASMVLLDGNFKTLVVAVEEGRIIFENIKKVIIYLLADGFSEIVVTFAAILFGWPLPLLAAQILFINLVQDTLPAIALSSSDEPRDVLMREKPRRLSDPMFNNAYKLWLFIIFFIGGFALLGAYRWHLSWSGDIALTQTFVFALTVVDSWLFAGVVSSLRLPMWRKSLFSNGYLILSLLFGFVLLMAAVYWPVLQNVLSTVPLSGAHWVWIVIISIIEVALIEITKLKLINSQSKKF